MKDFSRQWLAANIDIWVRQQQGNHKHLNETELTTLQAIAKEVEPGIEFNVKTCDECILGLILFVFTAYESKPASKVK